MEIEKTIHDQINELSQVIISSGNPNLELWEKGFKTDLKFTKLDHSGRLSISPAYRNNIAISIFGAKGGEDTWGVKVIREWESQGAPILINGTFSNFYEIFHHVEIELYYYWKGKRHTITAYGDTPKVYYSHYNSKFISDSEVHKKSLTDATDKQVKAITHNQEATQKALDQAKAFIDEMEEASNLAEIKTLQQKALAALHALPNATDEQKRKKSKAIQNILTNFERNSLRFNTAKNEKSKDEVTA